MFFLIFNSFILSNSKCIFKKGNPSFSYLLLLSFAQQESLPVLFLCELSRFQQKAEHSCAEKISLHNLMNIHELIIRYCARCDRSDLIKIRKKKIIETEKRHCKFQCLKYNLII